MKKIGAVVVISLLAYFLAWPSGITPQEWQAPKHLGYVGVFETNTRLQNFQAIVLDGLHGPEAIAQDASGLLYASTEEGWIVRWKETSSTGQGQSGIQKWVKLAGRPLGLAFDKNNNLWVADAYQGLVKIRPDGQFDIVVSNVAGIQVNYADDVAVAPNGKIYFSDASTKYGADKEGGTLKASLLDLMEHGKYGRIIEYDPVEDKSRVIVSGLSFANGVAVSANGDYLLVIETGEYRVIKHWLTGKKQGKNETVIDNLPGFPDNIHSGKDGRYWLGLTSPRNSLLDSMSSKPWLRNVVQRLPELLRPNVVNYGMVIAIDGDGKVLENLQDPTGEVYATTGAHESENYLYVASLTAPFITKYSILGLGL